MKYINKRKPQIKVIIGIAVCMLATLLFHSIVDSSSFSDGELYFSFIDVGQGDSALLTSPSGKHVLIDAGPGDAKQDLISYLKRSDVQTIEYLILSHPHEDHIGGAPAVLENFEVENVIMPEATSDTSIFKTTLSAIEKENCNTIIAEPGNTYTFDEVKIELLGPLDADEDNLNNASIVCKVIYGNNSFMFTGDMEQDYEKELIAKYTGNELDCDVLKIGHHGSSTSSSSDFLDKVSPEIAVISCGEDNEYSHPHDEVIQRLEDIAAAYYRTDINGTTIIRSDGKSVTLHKLARMNLFSALLDILAG